MFRNEKLQLKKRKNAALKVLLLSVFVTFMCLSMLAGTTYAWLTDSVTSGRNTVISGSLDVQLFYYNDQKNWVSAEGDVFGDVVWQPGSMYPRAVEIRNNGDLPVKFAFKANSPVEYGSINTSGEQFLVSNALRTYQRVYDSSEAMITEVGETLGGSGALVQNNGVAGFGGFTELTGTIAGNSSKFILLMIEMPTGDTGTSTLIADATTKAGMPSPKFDIELIVVARQGETSDSFGTVTDTAVPETGCTRTVYSLDKTKLLYKKTDANGDYYAIENEDDFARFVSVLNSGSSAYMGDRVKLTADLDLGGAEWETAAAAWPIDKTKAFAGTFEAGYTEEGSDTVLSHVIKGFKLNVAFGDADATLFTLSNNAKINNLSVNNVIVTRAADPDGQSSQPTTAAITTAVSVTNDGKISLQ